MFFQGFFLSGLSTWINRYSESTGAVSALMPAMSFMYLGLMLSRLIMAFLPVSTEKYVKTAGFAAGAVMLFGTVFPGALNICLLISGLFFGAMIPCMLTIACGRLRENTLTATTALMLALYFGEAFSSPVIGAIEKAAGLSAGILLCAAFMVISSLSALFG